MSQQPLSSDAVGTKGDPVSSSWTQKDAQLYALGVGARPYDDLKFLYEGAEGGLKVLPTFAVLQGLTGAMGPLAGIQVNPMMIVHGEQAITLHREIPVKADVTNTGTLSEVWDKGEGKGAVLNVDVVTEDASGPLFTQRVGIFVRGAGGFGGEPGPSTSGRNAAPDRAPDITVEDDTRPEQAAIYRLSGDWNPLHIDPNFAAMAGFQTPILHGLCTYGFVGRAVLRELCDNDVARFETFEVRFSKPVLPGDTIVTKIWRTGDNEALVEAATQNGDTVLSQARTTWR